MHRASMRATAYAAVDRHRIEDYKPYILRTRDFGKSWAKLGAGIPEGAFVNVVREDPGATRPAVCGHRTGRLHLLR